MSFVLQPRTGAALFNPNLDKVISWTTHGERSNTYSTFNKLYFRVLAQAYFGVHINLLNDIIINRRHNLCLGHPCIVWKKYII